MPNSKPLGIIPKSYHNGSNFNIHKKNMTKKTNNQTPPKEVNKSILKLKTIDVSIDALNYFKQGEYFNCCLSKHSGDKIKALQEFYNILDHSANIICCLLHFLEDLPEDKQKLFSFDADYHKIFLTGPKKEIDQLIKRNLAIPLGKTKGFFNFMYPNKKNEF